MAQSKNNGPAENGATAQTSAAPDGEADQLVRRFLDLWQEQVSASAADPEVASLMTGWLKGQAAMAEAAMGAGQAMMEAAKQHNEQAATGPADRPPPAAAAPRRGDDDLGELARRLDAIEKRLIALERGADKRGGKSSAPSRRRKS